MYQEQRRELERAESEMSQRFDAAQKISDQLLDDSMSECLMLCCIQVACDRIGSVAYNGGGHGDNISSSLGRQLSHHRITATWAIFCQQLKRGGHQQKKRL